MNIPNRALLLTLTVAAFASCRVEPPEFMDRDKSLDSTLLIRSIRVDLENTGNPSPITENYSYDTLSRKINITWDAPAKPEYDGMSIALSYNQRALLAGVEYGYPASHINKPGDPSSVSITYDDKNVLKTVSVGYVQLPPLVIDFKKTPLNTGYMLFWEVPYSEIFPNPNGPNRVGVLHRQTFTEAGQCIKCEMALRYNNRGVVYTIPFALQDSLIYDGSGNLAKVYRNSGDAQHSMYLAYEFESRETKGSQLADFRRLLLNGLDNIPVPEGDDWFWFSVLSSSSNEYEREQYSHFPIKTAKVYNTDLKVQVSYTASSTFDNLDRLTEFKGFINDGELYPDVFKITYYK